MRFCFHDWSKWSTPFDAQQTHRKFQSRHCVKCHKVEVSGIRQPWNEWFSANVIAIKDSNNVQR